MFDGEEDQTCIVCDCGANFILEEDYLEHLETSHGEEEKVMYMCSKCNQLFNTEEACTNHMKTHRTRSNHNKKKVSYNYMCEVCGKKSSSNAALGYHQRVHTGERPYQCSMCDKSFTMLLFLQIHSRTHTGEKPYQCESCSKAFTNRAGLLRHKRVHSGEKPYSCPRCGKMFQQSNSVKLHIKTVHDKMPAPYKKKKNIILSNVKTEHSCFGANKADTANVASGTKAVFIKSNKILD